MLANSRPSTRRSARAPLFACVTLLTACLATQAARAQGAEERASAAEAYDRGTAAYLAENYAAAARWFETADRLAPAAPALIQAVRAHQRAGHELRAATLALRLEHLYGDDAAAHEAAEPILTAAATQFVRVEASCEDCTLDLDGTLLGAPVFFVDPGGDHQLVAHFETGDVEQTFRGAAGDVLTPSFEAPEAIAEGPTPVAPAEPSGGLPRAVFITAAALTVGAGAALVWSGLDTNKDADAYEASIAAGDLATARNQLANGQDEERRTNILIGVTAGLGLTAGLLAAFTDWGGADEASEDGAEITAVGLAPAPSGGGVTVTGRF